MDDPQPLPDAIGDMFDSDTEIQALLDGLPKAWATCPDDPTLALIGPYVRASYGRGYMKGLEEEPTCAVAR